MSGASLCSGYGGLDLAARDLLGGDVVVHAEMYPPAAKVLETHWPDVPNVGRFDMDTDWSPWVGVDWVAAGWPCQPWSTAGRRKGAEDERAIWPDVARAIRDLGPRWVLLENVPAIAPAGELARALGDLAGLGFDAEWRCVPASAVGVPHRRRRIFILAVARDTDSGGRGRRSHQPRRRAVDGATADRDAAHAAGPGRRRHEPQHVGEHGGEAVRAGQAEPGRRDRAAADAAGGGRRAGESHDGAGQPDPARRDGQTAANTDGERLAGRPERDGEPAQPGQQAPCGDDVVGRCVEWAGYEPAIRRWEAVLGRPAPAPVVVGRRGGRQLSPRFVEWLMGLPAGWVTDVPGLSRTEQLHLLGNGVVPQQAALAVGVMLAAWNGLEIAA